MGRPQWDAAADPVVSEMRLDRAGSGHREGFPCVECRVQGLPSRASAATYRQL